MLYLNHGIFLKFGILGGSVGPGAYFAYFAPTLAWQGKGAFLKLPRSTSPWNPCNPCNPDRPLLQDISIINVV